MKIDDHFSVTPDAYCWILSYERKYEKEDGGQATQSSQTYHLTLKQALEYYLNSKLKEVEVTPYRIKDIVDELILAYNAIQAL